MVNDQDDWLTLKIPEVEPESFELQKLSKLFSDLSSALFSIAKRHLGLPPDRPGPRTPAEEGIAGFRLVRVSQGSLLIELEPPPIAQARLGLPGEVEPEDVAYEFYRVVEQITSGAPEPETDREILRRVATVVNDVSSMGPSLEIKFHPRRPERLPDKKTEIRGTFNTRVPYELPEESLRLERKRVVGHAYMVDVEPGKQRIRLKLTDGRDITINVDEGFAQTLESALNRDVEVDVEEEMDGGSTRRTVQDLEILESSVATAPKTIDQLEREQGISDAIPDYVALATAVWPTQESIEEFQDHIREIRRTHPK